MCEAWRVLFPEPSNEGMMGFEFVASRSTGDATKSPCEGVDSVAKVVEYCAAIY